ncbi:MAG TPA: hypothetical protein DD490_19255 [Acidobacteria bacterium]|nr:hypothetical protein [Acidobacteriota bacterium]
MSRLRASLVLGWLALAGCGADSEAPSRWHPGAGERGARLQVEGSWRFAGRITARCVPHDRDGLQINLRTGDPDLPTVAVRIDPFHGTGTYRGKVFITGRQPTGALAGSTGEVRVEIRRANPIAGSDDLVLGGEMDGSYDGPAGTGTVEGRFNGCPFKRSRPGSSSPAEPAPCPECETPDPQSPPG